MGTRTVRPDISVEVETDKVALTSKTVAGLNDVVVPLGVAAEGDLTTVAVPEPEAMIKLDDPKFCGFGLDDEEELLEPLPEESLGAAGGGELK